MKRIFALLLAILLIGSFAACQTPPVEQPVDTGDTTADTDAPVSADTTASEEDPAPVVMDGVTVFKNDGTVTVKPLTVPAEQFRILHPTSAVTMDENYLLILLWDETDAGEVENLRFTFVDLETGEFTKPEYSLDGTLVPDNAYRGIDGELYLKAYGYEDNDDAAWEITGEWYEPTVDTLTAKEAQDLDMNNYSAVVESEDGMWIAWSRHSTENRSLSGLWIRDAAGGVKQIKKNVSLDDVPADYEGQAIGAVRGYSPIGFIDDFILVYRIGGWEWTWGYGYYDTTTGEIREVENGRSVLAIGDGFLYTAEGGSYSYDKVYKEYPDGTEELIASDETNTIEELEPFFVTEMVVGLDFNDTYCAVLAPEDMVSPDVPLRLAILDSDLTTVHLTAEMERESFGGAFWYLYGDTYYVFNTPGEE